MGYRTSRLVEALRATKRRIVTETSSSSLQQRLAGRWEQRIHVCARRRQNVRTWQRKNRLESERTPHELGRLSRRRITKQTPLACSPWIGRREDQEAEGSGATQDANEGEIGS
jgi:hypothetical protein